MISLLEIFGQKLLRELHDHSVFPDSEERHKPHIKIEAEFASFPGDEADGNSTDDRAIDLTFTFRGMACEPMTSKERKEIVEKDVTVLGQRQHKPTVMLAKSCRPRWLDAREANCKDSVSKRWADWPRVVGRMLQ